MLATNDIAWGAIWIFGILIVVVWFARPAKSGQVARLRSEPAIVLLGEKRYML
jgi:cbb3-type cytochrome oxidase subunit 3